MSDGLGESTPVKSNHNTDGELSAKDIEGYVCASAEKPSATRLDMKRACPPDGSVKRRRWKDKDGFKEVVNMLNVVGFQLHEPWNNELYWKSNFRDVTRTHPVVLCKSCGYVNSNCTVVNLKKTKPGCYCTGRVAWKDPASRSYLQTILEGSRFRWMECAMDNSWWKANITGESCLMPVVCTVCEITTNTTIHNFKKRNGAFSSCGCSSQYGSIDLVNKRASALNLSIVECATEGLCSVSKIMVQCNECNFISSTTLQYLKTTRPSCLCSGRVRWSNVQMRIPFVEIVETTRFKVPEFALTDDNWTKMAPEGTDLIELHCKICGHPGQGIMHQFLSYHSLSCKCSRHQTEAMMFAVLGELVDKHIGMRWLPHGFVRYGGGGRYGFVDAMIYLSDAPIMAIELDGEQHFRSILQDPDLFLKQQDRDRLKEAYCKLKAIPLIRFYQPDVYYRRIELKKELQLAIEKAVNSKLPPVTYCSKKDVYKCVCLGKDVCAWCV
jgi:hypothetical protein